MSRVEDEVPFLDSIVEPLANALDLAFGCHHRRLSRVFTVEGRSYKVCCDCGAKFAYSWQTMSIVRRPRLFPAWRRLRAQRRHRREVVSG